MILANEHVAAFLAGRGREALFRVHERPDPQAIGLLLAKLDRPRRADATRPRQVLSPQAAAALAATISRRVTEYVEQSGRGGRRSRHSCCARSSRPATTRTTSGIRGSPVPRTATSPRRFAATPTSSSTGRSCTSSGWVTTPAPTSSPSSPSTPRPVSGRRPRSSISPTISASPGCSRTGWANAAGTSRGKGRSPG